MCVVLGVLRWFVLILVCLGFVFFCFCVCVVAFMNALALFVGFLVVLALLFLLAFMNAIEVRVLRGGGFVFVMGLVFVTCLAGCWVEVGGLGVRGFRHFP